MHVCSVYNWSPWKGEYPAGLSFAPMLWGDKQIGAWNQLITGNGNGAYALSFNEYVNPGLHLFK